MRRQSGRAALLATLVGVGLLTGCEPAAPPSWDPSILELDADGLDSAAGSPVFSPDGTRLVFITWRQLLPDDTNGWQDLYVHDLRSGETQLLTVNRAGTSSSEPTYPESAVFSPDGTKVAFESYATDLVSEPTGGYDNVFVRDLVAGTTNLVSVDAAGTGGGDGDSRTPSFSPDGTKVTFSSGATNLGPRIEPTYSDIFIRDLAAGTTSLVSIRNDGEPGYNSSDGPVAFTPDGTKVVFTSWADLTGIYAQYQQLYVRDLTTQTTELLSVNAAGQPGEYGVDRFVLSSDGTKVAFTSFSTNLVPADTNGETDVFLRNVAARTTTLVSSDASGLASANNRSGEPVFSPDGSRLAFTSFATDLGPRDTNQTTDVYLRDLRAGTSSLVTVNPAGTDAVGGGSPVFDPSGTRVAFVSTSGALGPVDTNRFDDVYVRDLSAEVTSLVSANVEGTDSGHGWSTGPAFTYDGAIVFHSVATDLDPRQTIDSHDLFVATAPATADLSLSLTIEQAPERGQDALIIARAANEGTSDAVGTTLAVLLPEEMMFVDAAPSAGTCAGPTTDQPRLVVCDLETLAPGDTRELRVTAGVAGGEGTPLTFLAATTSQTYDPDSSNNLAMAETTVSLPAPS